MKKSSATTLFLGTSLLFLGIVLAIWYPIYNTYHYRYYYLNQIEHPKHTYPFVHYLSTKNLNNSYVPGYRVEKSDRSQVKDSYIYKENVLKKGDVVEVSSDFLRYYDSKIKFDKHRDYVLISFSDWGKIDDDVIDYSDYKNETKKVNPKLYSMMDDLEDKISNTKRPLIKFQGLFNLLLKRGWVYYGGNYPGNN